MHSTERSALRLALGVLRSIRSRWSAEASVRYAIDALSFLPDNGIADAAHRVGEARAVSWRILRARLALYIRAVLRADRGERGCFWTVVDTWRPGQAPAFRPVRPLWLDARGVER